MKKFGHAIVVGASIGGMTAAGVVSRYFNKVTIIERDELKDEPEVRKGTPQAGQIHALLPAGLKLTESIYPGFREGLMAEGADTLDATADIALFSPVGWRKRVRGEHWLTVRRPIIDMVLRRLMAKVSNIEVVQASVAGLETADDRKKVTGVKLRDGTTLNADLVIAATGRRSPAFTWLGQLGISGAPETFVKGYTGYCTAVVRLPEGALKHGVKAIQAPTYTGQNRGVAIFPADNGLYYLSAFGAMQDHPSRNKEEFIEFLRTCAYPPAAEIAESAEYITPPQAYAIESSILRRWSEVPDMPDRFVIIGDSAASLNPTFGQGMAMSATGATLLDARLQNATTLDNLAKDFQLGLEEVARANFMLPAAKDAELEGASWSPDFTPPTEQEVLFAKALTVVTTQRADIVLKVADAVGNVRPADLADPEIIAACEEWLNGDQSVPQFDPVNYPAEVVSLDERQAA